MALISQDTINQIFETARIEEVIGEFVQLKRAGSNLKGLSPFSNEKTPSFMVSPAKQIFKDFSSGKGGSVVTFLMEIEQFTYPEALRWLAKKYNIEIAEDAEQTPEQVQEANAREAVYLVSDFAQKWFAEQLQTEEGKSIGLSYFKERGFSEETIQKFGLGYAPNKKDAFATAALEKGYSEQALRDSGISLKKEEQTHWYDRFWGRVIFPIYSISGRVLGFGGRVLKSDAKTAKYLNSPENPIYHKSRVLYGLYQSRKEIVKQDEALLVEGYTDVIQLHQRGVENVVASSGTALTDDQIRLINRYTKNITMLFDGDAAGIRASMRGIDLILAQGANVRVVLFPDGEDPDSFAKQNSKEAFAEFISQNRTDFIRFKAKMLMDETQNDPIKKADAIREIVHSIAKIPNEISREVFVKESARILQIEEETLFAELAQTIAKELRQKSKERQPQSAPMQVVGAPDPAEAPTESSPAKEAFLDHVQEFEFVKLLMTHGNEEFVLPHDIAAVEKKDNDDSHEEEEDFVPTVAQFLVGDVLEDETSFSNPVFQKVFNICYEHLMEEKPVPESQWYARQEDEELAQLAAEAINNVALSENWEKRGIFVVRPEDRIGFHAYQVALRFKYAKLTNRIGVLEERLQNATPDDDSSSLLEEFVRLNKVRQMVNEKLHRVV